MSTSTDQPLRGFQLLPYEIRGQIWKDTMAPQTYTLITSRKTNRSSSNGRVVLAVRSSEIVAFSVSHESRKIALTKYRHNLAPCSSQFPKMPFDPLKDTVVMVSDPSDVIRRIITINRKKNAALSGVYQNNLSSWKCFRRLKPKIRESPILFLIRSPDSMNLVQKTVISTITPLSRAWSPPTPSLGRRPFSLLSLANGQEVTHRWVHLSGTRQFNFLDAYGKALAEEELQSVLSAEERQGLSIARLFKRSAILAMICSKTNFFVVLVVFFIVFNILLFSGLRQRSES